MSCDCFELVIELCNNYNYHKTFFQTIKCFVCFFFVITGYSNEYDQHNTESCSQEGITIHMESANRLDQKNENPEEIITQHDGGIPIFSTRSAAETEAAHDLLSLSQSLPPLQAPGVVTIHHNIPTEERPTSPSYTYRPLSPEPQVQLQQPPPPPAHAPMAIIAAGNQLVYQSPIVYVVQVPAVPTPPTSECSSDAENNIQICIAEEHGHNEDIIILPMSPEPEGLHVHQLQAGHNAGTQTNDSELEVDVEVDVDTDVEVAATVIVSPAQARQQSVITSTNSVTLGGEKRQRRVASAGGARKRRLNNNNNNNNNSNHRNNNKSVDEEQSTIDEHDGDEEDHEKNAKTVSL